MKRRLSPLPVKAGAKTLSPSTKQKYLGDAFTDWMDILNGGQRL